MMMIWIQITNGKKGKTLKVTDDFVCFQTMCLYYSFFNFNKFIKPHNIYNL